MPFSQPQNRQRDAVIYREDNAMLKFNYESKSEIPAGLENYYSEKDGSFTLQAEGIKTDNDVQSVKDALDKERTLRRDAEKKNTEYESKYSLLPEDFDINTYNNLKDTTQGDIDAKMKDQRDRLTAQSEKEKAVLQAALDGANGMVQTHVIDASLSRAIAENNIKSELVSGVGAMMKGRVTLEGSEVYLDEKPIQEGFKQWAQTIEGQAYTAAGNHSGGGSNNANTNGGNASVIEMPRSEYEALPSDKKIELGKTGVQLTD